MPVLRHRSLHVAFLLVATLVAAGAWAAELVVRNLYVDLEFLPADFDYEIDDGNGSQSGSDAFDTGLGLAVGARYSFARTGDSHGFLVGAQVVVAQAGFNGQGNLTDYGLRAEGGYGLALNDAWSVDLLARLGYGWSTFDISDNAVFPSASFSGTALTYGGALGVNWAVSERWQISTTVGYLMTNYDLSGNDIDLTLDRGGMSASLGFLYRLSNLPSTLE